MIILNAQWVSVCKVSSNNREILINSNLFCLQRRHCSRHSFIGVIIHGPSTERSHLRHILEPTAVCGVPMPGLDLSDAFEPCIDLTGETWVYRGKESLAVGHFDGKHEILTDDIIRTGISFLRAFHLCHDLDVPTLSIESLHHSTENDPMRRRVLDTAYGDAQMDHLMEQYVAKLILRLIVEVAQCEREGIRRIAFSEESPAPHQSTFIRERAKL